ncbi:MAG: hypothetical protein AAF985_04440, partial [Bacteroidota bacterium]
DVLSASFDDDKIAWYENLDGQGTLGLQQIISDQAEEAVEVFATDFDFDGDIDFIAALKEKFVWLENLGSFDFVSHLIHHYENVWWPIELKGLAGLDR